MNKTFANVFLFFKCKWHVLRDLKNNLFSIFQGTACFYMLSFYYTNYFYIVVHDFVIR